MQASIDVPATNERVMTKTPMSLKTTQSALIIGPANLLDANTVSSSCEAYSLLTLWSEYAVRFSRKVKKLLAMFRCSKIPSVSIGYEHGKFRLKIRRLFRN
jgi:hypothetical protein